MQPWFVEFAEGVEDGTPVYRECGDCGSVALPPREVCPECGTRTLEDHSLSETATVTASTRIFSTIPEYTDDAPYTVIVATFDQGVRLTGQLREAESVDRGETVAIGAERRTEDEWLLTFTPTD